MAKKRSKKKKRISIISMFIIVMLFVGIVAIGYNIVFADKIKWQRLEESLKDIKYPEENKSFLPGSTESSFKNDTTGVNQKLVDSIYDKYGIKVYYGVEFEEEAKGVNATTLTNIEKANRNLKQIETLLKKYPKDFFKNLVINNAKKYTVAFYLIDKFSDDNIALAVKDNTTEYKLFISDNENFERSVHHELYHLIEYYMEELSGKGTLYTNWNKLNPINFEYTFNVEKITTKYVYNDTLKNKGAFFITNYSKYSSKEDRAEIFAEMMNVNFKPIYFNSGEPIKRKAEVIIEQIDSVLKNKNFELKDAYWKRLIK